VPRGLGVPGTMSPVRVAISVLLAGLALPGSASAALPGRDALNAAKDAASGALGKLNAEITVHTRTFVADYSINDRYVIEAARIAQRRSSSPKVQAFAQTLADDARTTEGELQQLLRTYNVDATLATSLDFRRRGMISELNTTPAFTRRYLEQQVLIQKEQRILLRRYAHSGRITAVKQFADRRLRKVDDFLSTLEHLQRGS
jgi:predicted outer membrane protein